MVLKKVRAELLVAPKEHAFLVDAFIIDAKGRLTEYAANRVANLLDELSVEKFCRICGCTSDLACEEGCGWAYPFSDLCDAHVIEEGGVTVVLGGDESAVHDLVTRFVPRPTRRTRLAKAVA